MTTTEMRFFALKIKKEKGFWVEVRTFFYVKTTTTTTDINHYVVGNTKTKTRLTMSLDVQYIWTKSTGGPQ